MLIEKAGGPGPGVHLRKHITQGHPAQVLLDAAEGADLLVVGSRGHGHGRPAA
jgi:nucleotide-binding universal stress UspA family protein